MSIRTCETHSLAAPRERGQKHLQELRLETFFAAPIHHSRVVLTGNMADSSALPRRIVKVGEGNEAMGYQGIPHGGSRNSQQGIVQMTMSIDDFRRASC